MTPDDAGFERSLEQLERAVGDLESGDLDLDESLEAYERGVRLLARCKGLLDVADRKVALLVDVDPDGRALTAPFDATASADGAGMRAKPE